LDLGQLEAGVSTVEKRSVDLQRLVYGAVQAMTVRFHLAKVAVSLDAAEVPAVAGDPDRLQRAFINVLDNALRHSSPDRAVQVTIRASDRAVNISIGDEGPGFSTTDLPRAFEQFYTGVDVRGGKGTGLGLAIARRIIDAHQGSITAANRPEGGAIVTVSLPFEKPDARA
jgi:signal transduction histidine kinase